MDPTAEGPVQLSDDCDEIDSLLEILKEILQGLPETHRARTPAAPPPQLCTPPTVNMSALISQHESVQNQLMTPWRPTMMVSEGSNIPGTVLDQNLATLPVTALDMLPRDLSETFFMDHKVTSFDQGKPTATSWITDTNDDSKTSFTDCQKTTIIANNMTISNEGSQMKTPSDECNLDGGQTTFSGDQAHYGGQTAFGGNQAHYGGQTIFSGDQAHYGGQTTFSGNQAHYGGQTTFSGNQAHYGGQTTFSGVQAHYGGQTTFSGDQAHYGGQTTFSGNQAHYGGQTTFSGDQAHYGGQTTFSGDQAHYGGQTTFSGDQAHYGGQMTFSGDQAHYGGQMTAFKGSYTMTFTSNQTFTGVQMTAHSGDQTLYGSQTVALERDQKTPLTDDHILDGSHMMPYQSTSLPYSGFLYFSNSHYTQGQSLEKQKSKLKTQRCQSPKNLDILKPHTCTYQDCGKSYSKRSHLQIHMRKHTGEKPYKCNVNGCTWEFARSDELIRHNRKHSGERPYLCTVCSKNFARADHLKQHQRVHSL